MTLDSTLAREIKSCNGDGTRDAKFRFLKKLDAASRDLSTPDVTRTFPECLKKHGRATVAICVAASLLERQKRLDRWRMDWAKAVLELWTNRAESNLMRGYIHDGLHPSRICEYAGTFIRATTEE